MKNPIQAIAGMLFLYAASTYGQSLSRCTGDCDSDGVVTATELTRLVNIKACIDSPTSCGVQPYADRNQVIADAIENNLYGCPVGSTYRLETRLSLWPGRTEHNAVGCNDGDLALTGGYRLIGNSETPLAIGDFEVLENAPLTEVSGAPVGWEVRFRNNSKVYLDATYNVICVRTADGFRLKSETRRGDYCQ